MWIFGQIWCRGWLVTDVWISTASILNLCAISIDRYVAVTRPVKYRSILTNRRAKSIVAIVWSLSFIICFPPLLTEWRPSGGSGATSGADSPLSTPTASNDLVQPAPLLPLAEPSDQPGAAQLFGSYAQRELPAPVAPNGTGTGSGGGGQQGLDRKRRHHHHRARRRSRRRRRRRKRRQVAGELQRKRASWRPSDKELSISRN